MIAQFFTNGTVTSQYSVIEIKHNIHFTKPYKSDANVEGINYKNMCDDVNICQQVVYFGII